MDALEKAKGIIRRIDGKDKIEFCFDAAKEANLRSVLVLGFNADGTFFSCIDSHEEDSTLKWIGLLSNKIHDFNRQIEEENE